MNRSRREGRARPLRLPLGLALRLALGGALRLALRLALGGALALGITACANEEPTGPAQGLPTDVVMVLDGVKIGRAELEDMVTFLETTDPTGGRNHTIRYVLDRHLIPLAFARRDFADQRKALHEMAKGLAKQLGNSGGYDELRELTKTTDRSEISEGLLRPLVGLPEQRWLFADENVGRASGVLELPQGFSVVAASNKVFGPTLAFEKVDACLVRFFTHKSKAHGQWVRALKERVGSLAKADKKVHPDYRDAVPPWLNPVTVMQPARR